MELEVVEIDEEDDVVEVELDDVVDVEIEDDVVEIVIDVELEEEVVEVELLVVEVVDDESVYSINHIPNADVACVVQSVPFHTRTFPYVKELLPLQA